VRKRPGAIAAFVTQVFHSGGGQKCAISPGIPGDQSESTEGGFKEGADA
jgi:hypothetical protein